MVPVQRTSTAWNMCTGDKIIKAAEDEPLRTPPPEAQGPGHWNSDGVWIKYEKEHGTIGPKPPPPNASGP
eukprot:3559276-Amphidinium_carterae.1